MNISLEKFNSQRSIPQEVTSLFDFYPDRNSDFNQTKHLMFNGNSNPVFTSKINSSRAYDSPKSKGSSSKEKTSLNRSGINKELNPPKHSDLVKIKDSIFIKKKSKLHKVPVKKIKFLDVEQNYCFIHTDVQKFVIKISLRRVLLFLSDYPFFRVNKRQVINMDFVTTINLATNSIHFEKEEFNLGRTYRNEVLSKLQILS